ncbi:MAG: NAD(P)-dependent oxidoreductase [Candidatus Micrarchaeaceae archaeon]
MQNKRKVAFVTGASGRLGSRLCKLLVSSGYEVRALVVSKEVINDLPAGVVPFVGTLDDMQVLYDACKGADIVVHTAALVTSSGKVSDIKRVNVDGTANLLDACAKGSCGRIVFSSSIDVYGRKRSGVITEQTKPKPSDKYGYSKLMAEREIINSGIAYVIFRIATIYGPGFERSFFKVFKAIAKGKISIIGKGSNHLAIVHINDVLKAYALAIGNDAALNNIFNLSDGVAYTQEGLIDAAADMLHAARPKSHVSAALVALLAKKRGLDSDELRFLTSDRIIDISKIKSMLGFEPSVSIQQGGAELVSMFIKKEPIL